MKFTPYTYTPLPLKVSEELISSLDENLSAVERSIGSIGLDITTLSTSFTATLPAGAALSAGDVCFLDTNGDMNKANASDPANSTSLVGICHQDLATGVSGTFILKGMVTSSGLTAGDILYIDTTAGGITSTPPSTSGDVVRIIGYAVSATQFLFDPDKTWLEVA